jgi:hypothetical protein
VSHWRRRKAFKTKKQIYQEVFIQSKILLHQFLQTGSANGRESILVEKFNHKYN